MKNLTIKKHYDEYYSKHGNTGKPGCVVGMIFASMLFVASGFNKTVAIDRYQKYAEFSCPYGRDGSCSETFRKDGIKALVCKCYKARKAAKS